MTTKASVIAVINAPTSASETFKKNKMKQFKEQDYTINICIDIIEWAKEFYGMPEGSVLENEQEVSSECMGFANIDEKEIWIFVPKIFNLNDLKETVAHEIGHIIEMEYPTNPDQTDKNFDLHELKADHYMNFYLLVDKIVSQVAHINGPTVTFENTEIFIQKDAQWAQGDSDTEPNELHIRKLMLTQFYWCDDIEIWYNDFKKTWRWSFSKKDLDKKLNNRLNS